MNNITDYFVLLKIIQTKYSEKDFSKHDIDIISKIFNGYDEIDVYNKLMEATDYDIVSSFELSKKASDYLYSKLEEDSLNLKYLISLKNSTNMLRYMILTLKILENRRG
jgi:dethiobiotin synthetase